MTSPANRMKGWIEDLSDAWGVRLGKWLGTVIGAGTEAFEDVLGKKLSKQLKPIIEKLEATGEVPPEMAGMFQEMKTPTGESAAVFLRSISSSLANGAIGKISDVMLNPLAYKMNEAWANTIMNPAQLCESYIKGFINEKDFYKFMRQNGLDEANARIIRAAFYLKLPSEVVVPIWLRDKAKWEFLWDEVRQNGVLPHQIEVMKELAYKLPTVQDIIQFVVKEVYSPEIADKFGQFQDYPEVAEADAGAIGIRPEELRKYWAAHWDLPSVSQGFEMLHRGVIDDDTLKLLLRALDVMPYWRDKLTKISHTVYTRVDARRMWDMGVLDDIALKKSYLDLGYDDEHAEKMTIWTKVYVMCPQIVARYKNGWMGDADVVQELVNLGLTQERAQWMYETKFKNEAAARTTAQRDLTMAQIVKGVKKGKITRAQAMELLTDMGYDMTEAKFILDVEIPEDDTDQAAKVRQLTKSEILAGLESGTITQGQARTKLLAIRYLPADADYILQVYQDSIPAPDPEKVKAATRSDIEKAVTLGLITGSQANQMLLQLGYSAAAASFILKLLATDDSPEKEAKRLALSKSDILEGLKSKTLTSSQAKTKLLAIGYAAADADYILLVYTNGIKPADPEVLKASTRSDIEKAVSLGLITSSQAYQMLLDLGYAADSASLVLAILAAADTPEIQDRRVELSRTDILGALKAGSIDESGALDRLQELGYSAEDAALVVNLYEISIVKPAVPADKDVIKAGVVTAVKQGLITAEDGYQLLIKAGFADTAAEFVLSLKAESSPFSPRNYEEFKTLTQSWRKSQVLPAADQTPEVLELQLQKAQAIAEGKNPMLEQQRIQIDTIRRQRRKSLITRDQEIQKLKELKVPDEYIKALVENDDTRLAKS